MKQDRVPFKMLLQRAKKERQEKYKSEKNQLKEESKRGTDPGQTYIFESSVGLISSTIKGKGNKSDAPHAAFTERTACTVTSLRSKIESCMDKNLMSNLICNALLISHLSKFIENRPSTRIKQQLVRQR